MQVWLFGITVPTMAPTMVFLASHFGSNAQFQQRRISLPLVPALIDNARYWLPADLPPAAGNELRALSRPDARVKPPRIAQARALARPRGYISRRDWAELDHLIGKA